MYLVCELRGFNHTLPFHNNGNQRLKLEGYYAKSYLLYSRLRRANKRMIFFHLFVFALPINVGKRRATERLRGGFIKIYLEF